MILTNVGNHAAKYKIFTMLWKVNNYEKYVLIKLQIPIFATHIVLCIMYLLLLN